MPVEREDAHLMGKSEVYGIDTAASWYHPTWCHSFDHHEWIHAELERTKGREDAAYDLYGRTVDLLRQVADDAGLSPLMRAKVATFLNGADWHEAVRVFVDGDE